MAHAEDQEERDWGGRSQPHLKDKGLQRSSLLDLSSKFQRKLKKLKLPTPTSESAKWNGPKTTGHVQKMKTNGFVEKKNQPNLTVVTTDSTCTCTSSQSQKHYSFEYQISSSLDQRACSQIDSDSMKTLKSFVRSPPGDEDLFNEWLKLYASSSGEKATADTYDEGDEREDFYPSRVTGSYQYPREIQYESRSELDEMIRYESQREPYEMANYESRRELDAMINHWTPRDLLSDSYSHSFASPTATAATNDCIPTPPAMASTSCSFNFDSFGLRMLKSVGESVSQIKAKIEGDDDEDFESDDDSSCTANYSC